MTDSQVVINWINHIGRMNVLALSPWLNKIRSLQPHFPGIQFLHVPREENGLADTLSKRALLSLEGTLFFELWAGDIIREEGSIRLF